MHRLGIALACGVLALLTACGDQNSGGPADSPADGSGDPTQAPPSTTPGTPTGTPTGKPTHEPTVPPSGALQKVRVVGVVVQVGDCVVVEDDNATTWTITGDRSRDLVEGDRVAVTGTPDLTATGCGGPLVQATRIRVVDRPAG
jgi:hypothetical protein